MSLLARPRKQLARPTNRRLLAQQLRGGYLGNIPTEFIRNARKYDPVPTMAHGQGIMWAGAEYGVQGVTELTECERCDDL